MALWMGTWLVGNLAVKWDWVQAGWEAVGVAGVTLVLGVATVAAYLRYLRETDELQRKIELDALALATGVGVVGGLTWWLLARTGMVPDAELATLVAVLMVTYSLGALAGRLRYR